MKYIITLLAIVSLNASAQRLTEKISTVNDTVIIGRTYTAATVDTSKTIDVRYADDYFVGLIVRDSATILVKYQVSMNNSTWSPVLTKDSISTVSNTGSADVVDFTNEVRGAAYIRFIFTESPYATHGTTSNTYDVIGSRRED